MWKYLLILFILSGCANKQHRIAERNRVKAESRLIDSLYLVKTIPVYIIDSLQNNDGSGLAAICFQQLTSQGFPVITREEASALIRQYLNNSLMARAVRDPKEREKLRKLQEQNPSYLIDEMKRARPFAQAVKVLPCYPSNPGCVEIKRNNHPYAIKTRKWVFNKEEGMTDEAFVSYIISALQPPIHK